MSPRRGLIGLLVVSFALNLAAWAAAPPAELTAEQKKKLAEWGHMRLSLLRLLETGQNEKVVTVLQRIAALEKEAFGSAHHHYLHTLEFQARMHSKMSQ